MDTVEIRAIIRTYSPTLLPLLGDPTFGEWAAQTSTLQGDEQEFVVDSEYQEQKQLTRQAEIVLVGQLQEHACVLELQTVASGAQPVGQSLVRQELVWTAQSMFGTGVGLDVRV
jgi:hypothetical protein